MWVMAVLLLLSFGAWAQAQRFEIRSAYIEPSEGVWQEENVKTPTQDDQSGHCGDDEEDFLSFCRRSVL